MEIKKRPVSMTVIGWILIVMGGAGLFLVIMTFAVKEVQNSYLSSGISIPVAVSWVLLGTAYLLLSGIGILNGKIWARMLYLVFTPVLIGLNAMMTGFRISKIPSIIFYFVILGFLTSKPAKDFFTEETEEDAG